MFKFVECRLWYIVLEKKAYYAFSSAHIFQKLCQNYATFWKLCPLSPKLCYLKFTLILRKIKIISSLTLSILTLMNIHIVHLPVLQSLAWQIRMCTHDLAFLSLLTPLCLRHVFWKPSGFWECSFRAQYLLTPIAKQLSTSKTQIWFKKIQKTIMNFYQALRSAF